MPRVARIVIPDVPHHVIQRGNNRQDVFFVDDDRRVYLHLLREHAERFRLDVIGYSLMTNHVHLVVLPHAADSLAKAIGRTDFVYTQHINRLHERSGHLWQNRFTSCALDEKHTVAAVRYAEQNPVRAGLAKHAWDYEWSSAGAHVLGKDPTGLLDMTTWLREWDPKDWRKALSSEMDTVSTSALRFSTARGRPLGSDSFLSKMESVLGQRVRPHPVGRPPGWRKHKGGRAK